MEPNSSSSSLSSTSGDFSHAYNCQPNPQASANFASSHSVSPNRTIQHRDWESGLQSGSFRDQAPTKPDRRMEEPGVYPLAAASAAPTSSFSQKTSSATSITRPRTLNRLQSKGLTLSIPANPSSSSESDSILENPADQTHSHPPATPSVLSSHQPLINSDQINSSPKKQRKRPVKLSLKPIGVNHELSSKSVPNSPLDPKLIGSSTSAKRSIGVGIASTSYHQESKDLRDTLRGTPRRRPSMPFGNKNVHHSSLEATPPSDSNNAAELSTPLSSHPSARRPEAYRDPSEHILSGRGSTLQHARSVYASGPVEILPGVWLGDEFNARDEESLMDLNIKTILNVSKETVLPFQEDDSCRTMKVRRRDRDGNVISFQEALHAEPKHNSAAVGRGLRIGFSRENSRDKDLTKVGITASTSSKTITDSRRNSKTVFDMSLQDQAYEAKEEEHTFSSSAPSPLVDDFFTPPTTANPLSSNALSFNEDIHNNSNSISPPSRMDNASITTQLRPESQTAELSAELSEDLDSPPHYLRSTSSTPNLQLRYHTPLSSAKIVDESDEELGRLATPRNGSSDINNYMSGIQEQYMRESASTGLPKKGREASSSSSEDSWNIERAVSDSDQDEFGKDSQERYKIDLGNETDQTSSTTSNSTARTSLHDSESDYSTKSHTDQSKAEGKKRQAKDLLALDTKVQGQNLEFPLGLQVNSINSTPTAETRQSPTLNLLERSSSQEGHSIGAAIDRSTESELDSKVILPLNATALNVPASPLQGRLNALRYIKLPWTHDEVSLASSNGGGFQLGCEIISEAIGLRDSLENDSYQEDAQLDGIVPQTPSISNAGQHQPQPIISTPKPDPNKGGVLVHCQCGVSRSATLVIAFVMQAAALGYDFEATKDLTGMHDCYSFVKDKSSSISPNCSLIYQLVEWERHLSSEANRLRTLLGVTVDSMDVSDSDFQSFSKGDNVRRNPSSGAQSSIGGGGGSKLKWAVETMDEEEWTRMRREEEMKDAEEQEKEKIKRLEEAKRLMQEKKKREEEDPERENETSSSTSTVGGLGGLGARRKKRTPSLLLGKQNQPSSSEDRPEALKTSGSPAPLKSARPKLGLNPSSLAKPLKNLTLESASESEENETEDEREKESTKVQVEKVKMQLQEEAEEAERKRQARDESRAQLEFGSPSRSKVAPSSISTPSPSSSSNSLISDRKGILINPRPLSTSSIAITTPRLNPSDSSRNSDSHNRASPSSGLTSASQSLSSIPASAASGHGSAGMMPTSASISSILSNASTPSSRRSSVQLTPSASFGARRQSAQERRNQHRRTFSSDLPTISKSTLQALGIAAAQAQTRSSVEEQD